MVTDSQYLFQLGRKIEELQRKKFKTQQEFSAACGVDERTFRRIIKQEQNPTILVLRKIAKGLDISLSELVDV